MKKNEHDQNHTYVLPEMYDTVKTKWWPSGHIRLGKSSIIKPVTSIIIEISFDDGELDIIP